jgi:CRP/FNR family transcriptional regulator, cyclic AMP receptor protein
MEGLERVVLAHPFFAGLDPKLGEVIAGCVRNHRFDPGQYLFHESDAANEFFLIRHGSVALEIVPPGQPAVVVATEHEGAVVGVSWLAPPYRWRFDAGSWFARSASMPSACATSAKPTIILATR